MSFFLNISRILKTCKDAFLLYIIEYLHRMNMKNLFFFVRSSFIFVSSSEVKEVFKTGDYNNVIEQIGKHGE